MAKTIVNPAIKRKDNMDDHVLKVMFDDNEPPKNYIWGHPDGNKYQWIGGSWKQISEKPNDVDLSNYVTKDVLDQKLKALKTELLTFFVKSINNVSGSDESLTRYVRDYLEPKLDGLIEEGLDERVSALEGIDHGQFLTEHQSLNNYYKKGDVINLYVSKSDLENSVANLGFVKADANAITDLTDRVETLERKPDKDTIYDDTEIKDRVSTLESIDHLQYITAEDV